MKDRVLVIDEREPTIILVDDWKVPYYLHFMNRDKFDCVSVRPNGEGNRGNLVMTMLCAVEPERMKRFRLCINAAQAVCRKIRVTRDANDEPLPPVLPALLALREKPKRAKKRGRKK